MSGQEIKEKLKSEGIGLCVLAKKMNYGRGYFKIYWLMPMIENYGISAEWLLFGKGRMVE